MNKLIVPEEQIRNFAVDHIKDFEGCALALRYLKAKFGDRVDDLTLYGPEIKYLIHNDKADWAINFMLNLLQLEYRIAFFSNQLNQAIDKMNDKEMKSFCQASLKAYSKICSDKKYNELKFKIEEFQSFDRSEYDSTVIEALSFFIQDEDKKFTRHITDALLKLAEAKCHLDLVQYPYEENIQSTALLLMEYVELW